MRRVIASLIGEALDGMAISTPNGGASIEVERPRDKRFGDFSSNVAMTLAGSVDRAARELAGEIAGRLEGAALFREVSVAGAGFINFRISPDRWPPRVLNALEMGDEYGRVDIGANQRALVEFVSANPTGPLHVGHGRGAAYGDSARRILSFAGYRVESEYYINDVGAQIENLGLTLYSRAREALGAPTSIEPHYKGDYIVPIAARFVEEKGRDWFDRADPDAAMVAQAGRFASDAILSGIREDLDRFRVGLDNWFPESDLHRRDRVERAIESARANGYIEERDGALWLKSASEGDEKDRVVRRSNGALTYLAADMAYHADKFGRGYDRLINVWGADHHGYVARLKAAMTALGADPGRLTVCLAQMVRLKSAAGYSQMSTRSGEFTRLSELIDDVGVDAARYFFLMRSIDSMMEFDIDLAREKSDENPVYYTQYAHARIANLFRVAREKGIGAVDLGEVDWSLIEDSDSIEAIKELDRFPEVVDAAARALAPNMICDYLKSLAGAFHRYYKFNRIIIPAEPDRSRARLALSSAIKVALRNGLALLGVDAPDDMRREDG